MGTHKKSRFEVVAVPIMKLAFVALIAVAMLGFAVADNCPGEKCQEPMQPAFHPNAPAPDQPTKLPPALQGNLITPKAMDTPVILPKVDNGVLPDNQVSGDKPAVPKVNNKGTVTPLNTDGAPNAEPTEAAPAGTNTPA